MSDTKTALAAQIENEITEYISGTVRIGEEDYSQHKLVRRISLFENHVYPTGKFDSQGNYKFWADIITTRIDAEVKNVDFDAKNIEVFSERKQDVLRDNIVNLKLREYLKTTGQSEEINSAIEEGAGWGNVVWKKIKGGYERVDLRNFYVINQSARTLDESPVIERHEFTQADLRAKKGIWDSVDDVIKDLKTSHKPDSESMAKETTVPYYEIFERNGEVCLKDLKEYRKEPIKDGDEDKFVLAKVICAGESSMGGAIKISYVVFADKLAKKPYKEYHRGRYKGKWFREGLYELLFDVQVRANQISNQLAQGLEYASKLIFASGDKLIIQNITTGLSNGDILRSKDIRQVEVRLQGFEQLATEWNRILNLANEIANSREVVQGITPTSGTPLGTTQLLNVNANKLFDFIREKFSIPFREIFEEWIIPELVEELNGETVLRLTGDPDILKRIKKLVIDDWYLRNLPSFPPHTEETALLVKAKQMEGLKDAKFLDMEKDMWKGYAPGVSVDITGEALRVNEDLQTFVQFAQLEADPVRRTALIEMALKKKGIDVESLPKTPPLPPQQPQQAQGQQGGALPQQRSSRALQPQT